MVAVWKTAKGNTAVGYKGYSYRFEKQNNNGFRIFRCMQKNCPGRLKTDEEYSNVEMINGNHSHAPNPEEIIVRKITHKMREESACTTDSINKIYKKYQTQLAAVPLAAAMLPSLRSVDASLYRKRHRVLSSLPSKRSEIEVPVVYRTTAAGENLLLHATNDNDLMIFCTSTNLRHLCESDILCVDGTFDGAPALFSQVLTLHGFVHGKLLPLVYCLMPSKEHIAYALVFSLLKEKSMQADLILNPVRIISDFDGELIASIEDEFPYADHQGCYFLFTQVYWYSHRFNNTIIVVVKL